MIYSIHRELAQPTVINHAIKCNFTDPNRWNIVAAKGNVLSVYRIYTTTTAQVYPTARMELVHDFTLQGVITSLASVRTTTLVGLQGLDSLLLTFKDAKMSLLEYNVHTQSLVTVSMHYFEKDEFKRDIGHKPTPIVTVDPLSRCAIMKLYREHFAILPFKYDTGMGDEDDQRNIPYLPSFVINEKDIDPTIRNVIAFKFLFGYVEPTLAILYEPDQTFAGRLAHRKDTVCLLVVSLNVFQKTYPVLYKVSGLPYNCSQLEAVPSPVGGVIIISNNAFFHVDQTNTPGFAAIVNPFFDLESHFRPIPTDDGTPPIPVKNKPPSAYLKYGKFSNCKDLGISLDGARCTFLNPDTLLLTTRRGDMYQVELIGDEGAGRSWNRKRGGVKDIKIKKLGLTMSPANSLFSLMDFNAITKPQSLGTVFEMDQLKYYSNFLFAGSVVADALLIQFVEPIDTVETLENTDDMQVDLEDELDADLYGTSNVNSITTKPILLEKNIKYRVCDSLMVTGPLRSVTLGQPASYSSYQYSGEPQDSHLEIVACGGYDTHGSLVVMHQSVRPVIITSFSLGDIDDIFSVTPNKTKAKEGYHKYLVISKKSGTNVLLTGDEIEEVERAEFYTSGPTLGVGTVLNESVILQVYKRGIVVLSDDGKKLNDVAVGSRENVVVSCSIQDPFVTLLMSNGDVTVMSVSDTTKTPTVLGKLHLDSPICAVALFLDDLPTLQFPTVEEALEVLAKKGNPAEQEDVEMDGDLYGDTGVSKNEKKELDYAEDDVDLYGDTQQDEVIFNVEDLRKMDSQVMDIDENQERSVKIQHWCFVVSQTGTLKIFSLPDLTERFSFDDFYLNHRFVQDGVVHQEYEGEVFQNTIEEILVLSLGADRHRAAPYVIARNEKSDVLVYKVILSTEDLHKSPKDRLAIQMIRVDHPHITREQQSSEFEGEGLDVLEKQQKKRRRMIPFDKIGARSQQLYAGVMVTGPRPFWIMVAHTGGRDCVSFVIEGGSEDRVLDPAPLNSSNTVRIHPMLVDGAITSFAPLHNVNVPYGFAYVNSKGLFRLAQLPPQFTHDHEMPICKVMLGRSAHSLAYHMPTQTYILSSSTRAVFRIDQARYMAAVAAGVIKTGEELPDSEKKVSGIQDVIEDREAGMYLPEINACQLELISPVTWETVDIVTMGEGEQIISLASVELASKETTSGRKTYVAAGTGFMRSEDLPCRGRLLVYDVIDVVPDPNNPQTNHKLKVFYSSDEKNPVAALCAVNGYLLATIGTKVLMYAMEEGDLNGIAFLDVSIFVVSLSSVKNFILIGDIYKSVWFVAFQEDPPKMVMLGKDLYPVSVIGSQFLISETSLAMLVSDIQHNLHVLTYEPFAVQSQGGQKLLRRGEMNLGYEIQSFARLRLRPRMMEGEIIPSMKMGIVAGTSDGGLCVVVPITEKVFKRMYGVYSRMVTHIEHYAGLNPRGYRQIVLPVKSIYSQSVVTGPPGPRGILDGSLLYQFAKLSFVHQREVAKSVGSNENRILDDLLDMAVSLEYF